MIYQYSSVKEVIGNVIRNTRITDTSYIADMPEWIGHAMSAMRTNMELVDKVTTVDVSFHVGTLPCGLVNIEKVHGCGKYNIEMGYIKTHDVCDGTIEIHYKSIPVDDDGFPLVPDNSNYKQALYWHCRAMMIGAGFEDSVFSYNQCDEQYEKYAARAIAGIRYPSQAMMASRIPSIPDYITNDFFNR